MHNIVSEDKNSPAVAGLLFYPRDLLINYFRHEIFRFRASVVKIDNIVVVLGLDPRIQRIWIPTYAGNDKNVIFVIFTKSEPKSENRSRKIIDQ